MDFTIKHQAKDYYVVHGFSIDTILKILDRKVSRKTLYNWKNNDSWDEARKAQLKKGETLKEELYDLVQQAIKEAKTNLTASNIFSVAKLLAAYRSAHSVSIDEAPIKDESDKPKQITPETIEKIEKEILGL